jgi:hypothetical protein
MSKRVDEDFVVVMVWFVSHDAMLTTSTTTMMAMLMLMICHIQGKIPWSVAIKMVVKMVVKGVEATTTTGSCRKKEIGKSGLFWLLLLT